MTINITFQVINSGRGPAHNARMTLRGEPAETLKIISGRVYVGEPVDSNLLGTIKDAYELGFIGIGKIYTFSFVLEASATGKYVFAVTADDGMASCTVYIV
jgi:hypothetical protein